MLIKRVIESELLFCNAKAIVSSGLSVHGSQTSPSEICEAIANLPSPRYDPVSMGSHYQFEFLPVVVSRLFMIRSWSQSRRAYERRNRSGHAGPMPWPERNRKQSPKPGRYMRTEWVLPSLNIPVNTSEAEVAIVIEGDIRSQAKESAMRLRYSRCRQAVPRRPFPGWASISNSGLHPAG